MVWVTCQVCRGTGTTYERDWQSGYEDNVTCHVCNGTGRVEDKTLIPLGDRAEGLAKRLFMEDNNDLHGELWLIGKWHQDGVADKYRARAKKIISYLSGDKGEPF